MEQEKTNINMEFKKKLRGFKKCRYGLIAEELFYFIQIMKSRNNY